MTLTLEGIVRTENPESLRKNGLVPAVMYGPADTPVHIAVPLAQFKKAFTEAGESTVVTLNIDGTKTDTLIHDVQFHAVSGNPIHADFYVFNKNETVEVEVPLEFIGESPAVKTLGGVLVKAMHEITVSALPKDLPSEIMVDISSLVDFESQIKVSDIVLPAGVEAVVEEGHDEVVALVDEPRDEVEEEETTDISSIEIEKKGKKEEEGEATA